MTTETSPELCRKAIDLSQLDPFLLLIELDQGSLGYYLTNLMFGEGRSFL